MEQGSVWGRQKKQKNNKNWGGPEHRDSWLAPKGLCSVKDGVCRCPTRTCCQQPKIYSWNDCSRYGHKCTVNILVYIIEFISHVKLLTRGKDPFALPNIIIGCLLAHFARLKSGRSLEGTTIGENPISLVNVAFSRHLKWTCDATCQVLARWVMDATNLEKTMFGNVSRWQFCFSLMCSSTLDHLQWHQWAPEKPGDHCGKDCPVQEEADGSFSQGAAGIWFFFF